MIFFEDLLQTIYNQRRKIPVLNEKDNRLENLINLNVKNENRKKKDKKCDCWH